MLNNNTASPIALGASAYDRDAVPLNNNALPEGRAMRYVVIAMICVVMVMMHLCMLLLLLTAGFLHNNMQPLSFFIPLMCFVFRMDSPTRI